MMKLRLIFVVSGILFFSQVNAAIIYTDVTDVILKDNDPNDFLDEEISLDIDADGTPDFTFATSNHMEMISFTTNIVTQGEDKWDVMKGLEENTSISGTAGFYAFMDAYLNPGFGDVVPSDIDKYLGIRITKNEQTHYGWIRIEITANGIIFKDYAYESVADASILTGDKGTITSKAEPLNLLSDVRLYPNPAETQLYIESDKMPDEISVTDATGRHIKTILTSGVLNTVPVQDLEAGIYYVTIKKGTYQVCTKFCKN